ncbi:hypothetical protein P3688_22340 [Vibrio parahaemolyticus]|nr:hypothetical protein [Vibrio parahaemolyticus]MDF5198133.1 hypothetical protein [Vibrio parahaemolyticus]MDF5331430.1 hypothetical protein [Vibrio parahaemolyticus]MDG2698298.1 hypothetical protein [Vibrio parahaemolyticus]
MLRCSPLNRALWLRSSKLILRENSSPVYTLEHIEAFRQFGKLSLGMSFTEADFSKQVEKITDGKPDLRYGSDDYITLEILSEDGTYVGDVIVSDGEDGHKELTIFTFPSKGGGIATKAICNAVEYLKVRGSVKIEALVRKENPYRLKIIKSLINNGFSFHEEITSACIYRKP